MSTTYLCNSEEGGTLENKSVAMNAVLCLLVNGLIDEPQQHSLTVIATLLGMDNGAIDEYSLADVGERLHARGYIWQKSETEEHFDPQGMQRLYQIKDHLQRLWRTLSWLQAESEFKINIDPTSGRYTYEYENACYGGYVYNKDGSLGRQAEKKTIGQAVRERNQFAASPKETEVTTAVGYPEEKQGEPEPFTVFHFGNLDEIIFQQDEAKIFALTSLSDFHEAAARDSGGKSGSNPVGFNNWGKTQKAGSKGKVGKHYGELTKLLRTRATQGATREEIVALSRKAAVKPGRHNRFDRGKQEANALVSIANRKARRSMKIKLQHKWHGTKKTQLECKRRFTDKRREFRERAREALMNGYNREPQLESTSGNTGGDLLQGDQSIIPIEATSSGFDMIGASAGQIPSSYRNPLLRAHTKDVPYDESLSGGGDKKQSTDPTERHTPIRELKGVPEGSFAPTVTMIGTNDRELASEQNVISDDSDGQDEEEDWDAATNSTDGRGSTRVPTEPNLLCRSPGCIRRRMTDPIAHIHPDPTSHLHCCSLCLMFSGRRHTRECNEIQATVTHNVISTSPGSTQDTDTADSTNAAAQAVELSRKDRKDLEVSLKQINQIKTFRTAAQQPYVKTIDSKGDVEMLFCDTGNNTASVMALDRYLVKQKQNPSRFTEVKWYSKEVGVQGIDKEKHKLQWWVQWGRLYTSQAHVVLSRFGLS